MKKLIYQSKQNIENKTKSVSDFVFALNAINSISPIKSEADIPNLSKVDPSLQHAIDRYNELKTKRNDSGNFITKNGKSFEINYPRLEEEFDSQEQYRKFATEPAQVRRLEMAQSYLKMIEELGVFNSPSKSSWDVPFVNFGTQDANAVYPKVNMNFVLTGELK